MKQNFKFLCIPILAFAFIELVCGIVIFLKQTRSITSQQPQIAKTKTVDLKLEPGPNVGHRIVPSQERVFVSGNPCRINSDGFRGAELEPDKFRITAIGDSVTFGWKASGDTTTYPGQLNALLNDPSIEVVNAGIPKLSPYSLLRYYVAKVAPLKSQVAILMVGWGGFPFANGGKIEPKESKPKRHEKIFSHLPFTFNSFKLLHRIAGRIKSFRETLPARYRLTAKEHESLKPQTIPKIQKDTILWDRMPEFERLLNSFITLIQNDGTIPVLVTLRHFLKEKLTSKEVALLSRHLIATPGITVKGWRQAILAHNEVIRKVAKQRGVLLSDCELCIPSRNFSDLNHLNDEGNRLLASQLAKTLSPLLKAHNQTVIARR